MPKKTRPLPPIDSLHALAVASVNEEVERHVTSDLTHEEQQALADRIVDAAGEAMRRTIEEAGELIADATERNFPKVLQRRRRMQRGFERRLRSLWGEALDYLEGTLAAFLEFGEHYFREINRPDTQPTTEVAWALAPLHARACRIGLEILTLLKAGLADGAHARWRTLHEIAIVTLVLQEGGDELAERYRLHKRVADWKVAKNVEEHVHLLGWEPTPPEEMAALKARVDELRAHYGSAFAGDYGWACGFKGLRNPDIGELEAAVEASRWRPIAKWANDSIHSGPRGLFLLGDADEGLLRSGILAAGASNRGLDDPGQNTALALELIASALAADRPTGDRAAMLNGLSVLTLRAQRAFIAAGEELSARVEAEEAEETENV